MSTVTKVTPVVAAQNPRRALHAGERRVVVEAVQPAALQQRVEHQRVQVQREAGAEAQRGRVADVAEAPARLQADLGELLRHNAQSLSSRPAGASATRSRATVKMPRR
jgi:hypothetical protein